MIMPKLLCTGDTVAVIATSGACNITNLENGVKTLQNMGLNVQIMPSCFAKHEYLAGEDSVRLKDLHTAFWDKKIKGIFVARGGYGAGRLLPFINYELVKKNPKVFVGFSDVTALHIAFNQFCNLITFHGVMPAANVGNDECSWRALQAMIFEPSLINLINQEASLISSSLKTIVPGRAKGILTGGNLTLVASSLGTPYEINTRRRILFLEEIQEEPYRVDRLFLQLKQAGKFRECSGIILGDFSPETLDTLKMAIDDLIVPENKPTVGGLKCGHTTPTLSLPLGCVVEITKPPPSDGNNKSNFLANKLTWGESEYQLVIHSHLQNVREHK